MRINSRTQVYLLAILTCLGAQASQGQEAKPKVAAPAPQLAGQRLLVFGWGMNYIAVIHPDGTEEWRIPTNGRQCDGWMTKEGTIIYSDGRGVREVRRNPAAKDGVTVVWEWKAAQGCECNGCQPLPDGRVLIAESHPERVDLIEIERGTVAEKFRVIIRDPVFSGPHHSTRQVRKTAAGTYLFALMKGNEGREYDSSGKLLRSFPDVRFALKHLPDGGYLGAGGDNKCVIGFDDQGKETWRIREKDIHGFQIGFAAGVHRLDDGSLLVVNWGGHAKTQDPCLGLISADRKKLLWSLRLSPANRLVDVQLLERVSETTRRQPVALPAIQ